jgi:hypothetical protein
MLEFEKPELVGLHASPRSDLRIRGHFGATLEQAKGGSELVSATKTTT